MQVVPGQTAAPGQTIASALLGGASGVAQDPKTGALTAQTPIPIVTPKPGTAVSGPLTRSASTKTGLATAAVRLLSPLSCECGRTACWQCMIGLLLRFSRHMKLYR